MPMLMVCLPTYNERENIEPMLRSLAVVLATLDGEARVLVVDDASPDGTGAIADRLAGELPFLTVLHRERKEGLGPAYLAAFRASLSRIAESRCEILLTPHPSASAMKERMTGAAPLFDEQGCKAYAAKQAKMLDERVAKEKGE